MANVTDTPGGECGKWVTGFQEMTDWLLLKVTPLPLRGRSVSNGMVWTAATFFHRLASDTTEIQRVWAGAISANTQVPACYPSL